MVTAALNGATVAPPMRTVVLAAWLVLEHAVPQLLYLVFPPTLPLLQALPLEVRESHPQ